MNCGTSKIAPGIISVINSTTKILSRPGKRSLAKENPSEEAISTPIVPVIEMKALFKNPRASGICVQMSA
ncbi:MAG: hypothetical protein U0528_12025 [Anaerolineae bacterium]